MATTPTRSAAGGTGSRRCSGALPVTDLRYRLREHLYDCSVAGLAANTRQLGWWTVPQKRVESVEFALRDMVGHLLRTCQQVHVALWAEMFPGGLTSPQFAVLHALAHEGALTQVALRSQVRLDRSSTADVVRRLVLRRLVTQVKDPDDARRRLVRLTAAGRALYAEATVRANAVNEAMLAGLDEDQRAQLVTLLRSLLEQHKGLLDYRES